MDINNFLRPHVFDMATVALAAYPRQLGLLEGLRQACVCRGLALLSTPCALRRCIPFLRFNCPATVRLIGSLEAKHPWCLAVGARC